MERLQFSAQRWPKLQGTNQPLPHLLAIQIVGVEMADQMTKFQPKTVLITITME